MSHDIPMPNWFFRGMALVLRLMDASVPVTLERPVDRQLRPLGRRDRHAVWPRVQHRAWQAGGPGTGEGPDGH